LRGGGEATIAGEDRDRRSRISGKRLREEGLMLVLSRKLGQSFHVGEDVRITIVKIDRNSVRIGIHAPDEVSIQREEIAFEVPEPRSRSCEAGAA
jgi:carbon storage regulator